MTQLTNPEREVAEREEREQQERTAQKAAAERRFKREVFQDALRGIGITPGTDSRPGVIEIALRNYVKYCEVHMGALLGANARMAGALYGGTRDATFTPQMSKVQRRLAQDALFVLQPAELERSLAIDWREAEAHHSLVTAHEKRCHHIDDQGQSTWRDWVFEPLRIDQPGRRGQKCVNCGAIRDCQHRFVAFGGVTFDAADPNVGRSRMRCADCGMVTEPIVGFDPATEESVGVALVARNEQGEIVNVVRMPVGPIEPRRGGAGLLQFSGMEVRVDDALTPGAYRIEQNGAVIRMGRSDVEALRREAGQESSNADPVATEPPGKAPPKR